MASGFRYCLEVDLDFIAWLTGYPFSTRVPIKNESSNLSTYFAGILPHIEKLAYAKFQLNRSKFRGYTSWFVVTHFVTMLIAVTLAITHCNALICLNTDSLAQITHAPKEGLLDVKLVQLVTAWRR